MNRVTRRYAVENRWFNGEAQVGTFALEELMATKFRALYQRSKGRDLYDLWHVLHDLTPDDQKIVDGLRHYMKDKTFTYPQLAQNLKDKLDDPDFANDLSTLVIEPPGQYQLKEAADLIMERLASKLHNAPALDEIAGGAWRNS